MRDLGRRGGLRGGPARARSLDARRRVEIAKDAAAVRWSPVILMLRQPRDLGELHCFVAQYGNGYARAERCDPSSVLLQAITACRNDAGLARMIPVFVYRARAELFGDPRRFRAVSPEEACVLGYFLELTCRLGNFALEALSDLLRSLRRKIRAVNGPVVLFHKELAPCRPSALAHAWKLGLGESEDSFDSYFRKMLRTAPPVLKRLPTLGKDRRAPI